MRIVGRVPILTLFLLLAGLSEPTPFASEDRSASAPVESGLHERVEVRLAEVKILVTNREGTAVRDLRPEEIEVYEGRRKQKLAFLEPWSGRGQDPSLALDQSLPASLYTAEGTEIKPQEVKRVLPPKPTRRIVLAFDVRNSKIKVREEWRTAALQWVRDSMSAEDRVAVVVLRSFPDWAVRFTSDRDVLAGALQALPLFADTPSRDRRKDISYLLTDLHNACENQDAGRRGGGKRSGAPAGVSLGLSEESSCGYTVAKPYVEQWGAESAESIQNLRQLTGQISAVPGRKAVLLFSEGINSDPANSATNAMLSIWGADVVSFRRLGPLLNRNFDRELSELHDVASSSDVVFFTLDTRTNAERGYFESIEEQVSLATGSLGVNPWNEIFDATRDTLNALAYATGGRPFNGNQDLGEHVFEAADSFYGVYTVGYYRTALEDPRKLKIKVHRPRLRVQYPDRVSDRKHAPHTAKLELSVGLPSFAGGSNLQKLPVAIVVPLEALPLRSGAGGYGCQIGVFLQAIRPDGKIAAERFETAVVLVSSTKRSDLLGRNYEYRLLLEVPPGPCRIRARVSDDSNEVIGDRFIDLTVLYGSVQGGFLTDGDDKAP